MDPLVTRLLPSLCLEVDHQGPFEVGIIVQDARCRRFRGGGDHQIGDLDAAVVEATDVSQPSLNLERSLKGRGIGCDDPERRQLFGQRLVVFSRSRRPENLKSDLIADSQLVPFEIPVPLAGHFGVGGVVLGTVLDNDPTPTVSIDDATVAESDGIAALELRLSSPSAFEMTADYVTTDGTATVEVEVLDDPVDELDETFLVLLSSPSHAEIGDGDGVVTIAADDQAEAAVEDASIEEGDQAGGDAVFHVTLSNRSDRSVTVDYATADDTARAGDDYLAVSGTVELEALETGAAVTVPVLGDEATCGPRSGDDNLRPCPR